MAYSFLHGTYPTFVLNAVLLPLNAWRLHGMLKLIHDIDAAAKTDLNAAWLLPYMSPKSFKAGDIMMRRGEQAQDAFYVTTGEVELVEIGKTVGPGTLLGEIGLFTPDGLRVATARCKTDVEAARIDYDRFKQLYFQNPQFGFRLLHLIVGRLQEDAQLPRVSAS
jgi:CRP/FNR family cyclic AMP-dependent transcriptional regulator